MDYLPIFLDARERVCLLVGGGEVALRKAELLLQAGARIRIVAPELCESLQVVAEKRALEIAEREYRSADLDGAQLVVAATDDSGVNARVAADARERGVLVNVVDSPALCSFIMPAIVDRNPIIVAISSGGASPVLARLTRSRVEATLPDQLGRLAAFAAEHRAEVKLAVAVPAERRRVWERVFEGEIAALVLEGRAEDASRALERMLADGATQGAVAVAVIDCAGGDADRLSRAALRQLGAADVVLDTAGLAPRLDNVIRRDAVRIAVEASESKLIELVSMHVRPGRRVALLWSGDELTATGAPAGWLRAAGVRFVVLRPAPDSFRG